MNLNFFTYPKGISINVQFNKHKGEPWEQGWKKSRF